MIAPFGLPSTNLLTIELALEEYGKLFQQWEEFLSRQVHSAHGVSDDEVAASMSFYLQQQADVEVLSAVRSCQLTFKTLVVPPSVVEIPDNVTASIIASVILKLSAALQNFSGNTGSHQYPYISIDQHIFSEYHMIIPNAFPLPAETVAGKNKSVSGKSDQKPDVSYVKMITDSLIVTLENGSLLKLTYDQYISLLEIYSNTDIIRKTILQLKNNNSQLADNIETQSKQIENDEQRNEIISYSQAMRTLDALRIGFLWDGISKIHTETFQSTPFYVFGIHPCISLLIQEEWKIDFYISTNNIISNSSPDDNILKTKKLKKSKDISEDNKKIIDLSDLSLSVFYALSHRQRGLEIAGRPIGMSEDEMNNGGLSSPQLIERQTGDFDGDVKKAYEVFSLGISGEPEEEWEDVEDEDVEDEDVEDEEEKEDKEEDGEGINTSQKIPAYLLSELLTDRAGCDYVLENFDKAMKDCNQAIELNRHYGPAYAQRAKLWRHISASMDDRNVLLKQASDLLAAFQLGGGANTALAAEAEELAREACKDEAKTVFSQKRQIPIAETVEGEGQTPTCNFPRDWIVDSYLSGYELLSSALNVTSLIQSENDPITDPIFNSLLTDGILEEGDIEAYKLLGDVISSLESIIFSDTSTSSSSTSITSVVSDVTSEEVMVVPTTNFSHLRVCLEHETVFEGVCHRIESVSSSSSMNKDKRNIKEQEHDGISSTSCTSSKGFIHAFLLLQEGKIYTGVEFTSTGYLKNIQLISSNNEKKEKYQVISSNIRARLLNVTSIILYLLGDSYGASEVLRESIVLDPNCDDSKIKLASVLSDMGEEEEAAEILSTVSSASGLVAALHFAEIAIQNGDFHSAVGILKKEISKIGSFPPPPPGGYGYTPSFLMTMSMTEKSLWWRNYKLYPAIWSLLGVAMFRDDPNQPESALELLREATELHPYCETLHICLGELLAQVGDVPRSMSALRKASTLAPFHPMPYLNAARTLNQLGCKSLAKEHTMRALELDPNLSTSYVDLAQSELADGNSDSGRDYLEKAMSLAHHVSEIRDVLTARTLSVLQLELEELRICLSH